MNATVYLFGEFNSGYTQYPDDYTSAIFKKFYLYSKSSTQIAIHREGNLMFYGYIRKLEGNRYIGLCVVINGLLLTRIDRLFSLFENTISRLVTKGELIHFNEHGEIVTNVGKLYLNSEEIDTLTEVLRAGFARFQGDLSALPAISFASSKDSCKEFVVKDNITEIINSSHTNAYTFIYKSKGFNTSQMNSYKGVITKLNKEKDELLDKLDKLQTEHAKTLRQKKQVKFVLILLGVLLICTICLFVLNDNLNMLRDELSEANETISMQNDSISQKNTQISNLIIDNGNLNRNLKVEESRRIKAENSFNNLNNNLRDRYPFIVKNTSFDFRSGYLKIEYYGMTECTIKVNVRVYSDKGLCSIVYNNIDVSLGDNSVSVFVNRQLDRNTWYSFEILKDQVFLGGGRH